MDDGVALDAAAGNVTVAASAASAASAGAACQKARPPNAVPASSRAAKPLQRRLVVSVMRVSEIAARSEGPARWPHNRAPRLEARGTVHDRSVRQPHWRRQGRCVACRTRTGHDHDDTTDAGIAAQCRRDLGAAHQGGARGRIGGPPGAGDDRVLAHARIPGGESAALAVSSRHHRGGRCRGLCRLRRGDQRFQLCRTTSETCLARLHRLRRG